MASLPLPPALPADAPMLDAADAIGCRIVRDALRSADRCTWMIWTKEAVQGRFQSVLRTAPAGLYLGVSGIALFLAHLVRFTGDTMQQRTLDAALRQVEALLADPEPADIGYYSGASGAAWTLIAIGRMTGEARWIDSGLAALTRIAERAEAAAPFDLLGGRAGLIAALLAAGTTERAPGLIDAAERAGHALVAAAQWSGGGASWACADATQNLLGLSHGTTGVLLSLLALHRVRPDDRFRDTALAALAHERARFDPAQRNWPDYRTMPGLPAPQPSFPVAWCHGSTGIGLARVRMLDWLPDDPQLLPELDVALTNAATALNIPLSAAGTDITLCHGLLGHSELLLEIGDRLQRPDALAAAVKVGETVLHHWARPRMPWPCGIPDCGESPSLMTGSAGIGLHFLRLHDRRDIPSPLLPPLP